MPMVYSTFLLSRAALASATSPPAVTHVTSGLTHLGGFKMRVVSAQRPSCVGCHLLLLLMHLISHALKAKQAQ